MPELIEKYRVQREAWMAQADELARLRDEVRGSAEREAMEIVTTARRDIRRIVMEARRELFVLSAQVQAALGEAPSPAQIGPAAMAHDDEHASVEEELSAFAQEEWGFAPRSTVASVLEEARADMAILDQDARAVPARKPVHTAVEDYPSEAPAPVAHPPGVDPPPASPAVAATDADATPIRWFAAVFVFAAAVVVLGTIWMLRPAPRDGDAADAAAATQQADLAAPTAGAGASPSASAPAAAPAPVDPDAVHLSIEAVRPAWIRAIVDGRADAGQTLRAGETYEFTGRSIALRVGDAGAVLVSVNGGEARPLGRDGQVVNREYTLDAPAPSDESRAPADDGAIPADSAGQPGVAAAAAAAGIPDDDAPAATPIASAPSAIPGVTSGTVPSAASTAPPAGPVTASAPSPDAAPPAVAATTGNVDRPSSPPPSDRAASASEPAESTVLAATERWLDAYQRQDRVLLSVLSTPDVIIADERPTSERIPITAGAIARTLDRVSVRIAADTAVLTGIMTERAVNGGLQRSSPVSLVWVANGDSWRLSQARLVPQSTLSQIFR